MKKTLFTWLILIGLWVVPHPAMAHEGTFQIVTLSQTSFLKFNTNTGEVTYCYLDLPDDKLGDGKNFIPYLQLKCKKLEETTVLEKTP